MYNWYTTAPLFLLIWFQNLSLPPLHPKRKKHVHSFVQIRTWVSLVYIRTDGLDFFGFMKKMMHFKKISDFFCINFFKYNFLSFSFWHDYPETHSGIKQQPSVQYLSLGLCGMGKCASLYMTISGKIFFDNF